MDAILFSFGCAVLGDDGEWGTWWASTDDGERASGTWRVGSWDVLSNNTSISDDDWMTILDDNDFWQGDTDSIYDFHVGSWNGTNFTYIGCNLMNVPQPD